MLGTLTQPKKMTIALRMAQIVTGGIVPAPAVRLLSGNPSRRPDDRCCRKRSRRRCRRWSLRRSGKRARVGVLSGCAMRVLFGDVNADTVRVLAANGCEVLVNRRQGCCGALHGHNGYGDDARRWRAPD